MISVKLPDGSAKQLSSGASASDLAKEISDGLARVAVAAKVDGRIVDLAQPLPDGAQVQILTKKDKEALEVLRHSAAHLMADAILRVFPKAQLTIGPVVEEGFYYDIYLPDQHISVDDFPRIEAEMQKIAKEGHPFVRCVVTDESSEVYQRYRAIDGGHNKFKQELVAGIKQRGEELSFYKHGEFIDLCRGPHVPDTGWLKHVKLTKVSGSYWRADAEREQLQRVYGIAFFSKSELDDYFKFLEEARKRDHRVLGEQLELFFMDEDAPGFPFFYPKGAVIWNLLVDFMRKNLRKRGYVEVKTPLVLSEQMWHTSGHYSNYLENMFFTKMKLRDEKNPEKVNENVQEERPMAVKPMNCPGHLMLYRTRLHSHNEFPLRIAEMGLVHRRELSGVRHGLFRVQAFTQDDAHHFCTPEQIKGEIGLLIDFFREIYGAFGLDDVHIELSTRPVKSIGSDEVWEQAESALKETLSEKGAAYKLNAGDGAFYGPKIDFHIRDTLKRSWQCGTIQLDFSMPARFGLVYVGADGQRHTPVMIHRACYGSVERFMGILIEHFGGAFPLWLAPTQATICPVSEKSIEYARGVHRQSRDAGLRVELDDGGDRIGAKIRRATLMKTPYIVVIGEQEAADGTVNVRTRAGKQLGNVPAARFIDDCRAEIAEKRLGEPS
jgi:threonyl-tRNA synthetase